MELEIHRFRICPQAPVLEEYEKHDPAEPENDEDDMRSEIE